jgi:hypothetical protein
MRTLNHALLASRFADGAGQPNGSGRQSGRWSCKAFGKTQPHNSVAPEEDSENLNFPLMRRYQCPV